MYKIQKNIPIPTKMSTGRKSIYPFESMDIGDSFAAPAGKAKSVRSKVTKENKLGDKKFTVRTIDKYIRVWRIQ